MTTIEILPRPSYRDDRSVDLDLAAVERRVERYARFLDAALRIPGTQIRFGADSLIGLVPGIGDAFALCLSGLLLLEAHRLGASGALLTRMALNLAVDAAVGSVPIVGDLFDVAFRANMRNLALLRGHLANLKADAARPVPQRTGEA